MSTGDGRRLVDGTRTGEVPGPRLAELGGLGRHRSGAPSLVDRARQLGDEVPDNHVSASD